jgi:hypothetical protein
MAAKIPIRTVFDGSTATGLAEFQSGEFIDLAHGGIGASLSIGSAGQVLKVNSGASALEFGTAAVAAAQTTITSIFATDLILGEDTQTAIDFGTANEIDFKVDNAARLTLTASALHPVTDDQIDLGTASLEFKNAFFDGTVTSDAFAGPLTGAVTGDVTGNADTATALATARTIGGTSFDGSANIAVGLAATATALATARTIGGTSFDGSANIDVALATLATTVTITDNESTNENNALIFTAGGDVDGGNLGLESDGTLTYNPSTGKITATGFVGALTGDVTGDVTGNADTATVLATARTIGGVSFNGSANINLPGVNSAGNQNTTGSAATLTTARTIGGTSFNGSANIDVAQATLATTVTVTDSTANTNFPVVFNDESNALLDDTGALRYNPSTGTLLVPNLVVAGTTTQVDTVTMNAANAVVFEGATADVHETTLTVIDPTADRTINLPNVGGTIPVLAAVSTTQITSTPEELNALDGITAVVGELNALDIGSTAVGTAVASKAVILDSNKDYTGVRNLTISGEIDAATGDYSGAVDIAGATTTAAITASGIIKTDDSTAATSTTDGSLQTDGGLSVVLDAVIGDDIIMLSDAAQIAFGANSEITLAHVHNVGLTVTHVTAGDNLPVVLQLKSEEDVVVANEVIASIEFAAGDSDGTDGATVAAGIHAIAEDTFSASANKTKLVFTTGVSETAASSATAKATLSSIGDFTVAGDLIIKDGGTIGSASDVDAIAIGSDGDITLTQDLELQHDGAILSFGANDEVSFTHVHNTGILLNSTNVIQFNDASQNIGAPSNTILDINATDEIELNATLVDVNANLDVSGGLTVGAVVLAATDTDTSNTGSVTLDFSANQNFVLTFTGNVTLANPSTEAVGQAGVIVCIQDGTGSRTLSLGTDYESPAGGGITLSTAANAVDVVPYFVKASGSIQLGAPQLAFS